MIIRSILAGSVIALGLATAVMAASQSSGSFVCRAWNSSKNTPAVTHCMTWGRDNEARMQTAPCDPASMSSEAMRVRCAELSGAAGRAANS